MEDLWNEKGSAKLYKELIVADPTLKDDLIERTWLAIRDAKEDSECEYFIEICQVLSEFIEPQEAWNLFREKHDISKK